MSVSGASNGTADDYDHAIFLVDGSRPSSPPEDNAGDDPRALTNTLTLESGPGVGGQPLSRKWTLREEIARRKYAKWQGNRRDGEAAGDADSRERSRSREHRTGRGAGSPGSRQAPQKDVYEVDVLYENQRGLFLCGVPLYSRRGLMHFDPAPWSNVAFKDSPVDITNAQPPDPSWEWAWKSWFVDMSADVDEEGWQYSFSFAPAFSWHGTHLWSHSFVRRRRWLRKRVKRRRSRPEAGVPGAPDSSLLSPRGGGVRHSMASASNRQSYAAGSQLEEIDLDQIRDVDSLMGTLRSGRIDREKVEAVSMFIEHGDEDIVHLAELMPEIMSLLIFQASRRQLLSRLLQTLLTASERIKDHIEETDGTHQKEKKRVESLEGAVHAAEQEVKRLEYWSDIKEMVTDGDTMGAVDPAQGWGSEWQGVDASHSETRRDLREGNPADHAANIEKDSNPSPLKGDTHAAAEAGSR
ncbi:MAG: hypothetical protein M1823_001019 [Watsoniomyces obsoletus]|nr:MAG: hypothetical protein M1823_001019 [Watsoniomyces obsoletus]